MQAIKLDVAIRPSGDLRHDAEQIKRAEQLGFDAVWVSETAHNPFFPLTIATKETKRIQLGAQAAAAFPRSPMVTAQIAWDLARQSNGRFMLGLGAQTREHIERRFSEDWGDPVGRMREYIESLRAIWDSFQTDARLRYRGKHYQFRLMAPFFNPGPISHPAIPIFLTGLNPKICQLAAEIGQGLHAPALHTPSYLRKVAIPAIEKGLAMAHRERNDFVLTASVFVLSGETDGEWNRAANALRERLSFYASAPAYRHVMSLQGWGALADELHEMARQKRWAAMQEAITDDALREFALVAEAGDVYDQIVERYGGIADRARLAWDAERPKLFEAIASSRA